MILIDKIKQNPVYVLIPGFIFSLIFLYIFEPLSSSFYPPCPVHLLTGLYCPGCGSLRALHQLLNGHPIQAFQYNPLMVLSIPFIIYSFLSYVLNETIGKKLPGVFIPASFIWFFLIIILVFTILRNITIYPFKLLAP